MNLVHLIDNFEKVNFGIWNAALFNSKSLIDFGYKSFILLPKSSRSFTYESVKNIVFEKETEIAMLLKEQNFNSENTIIISHGCWQWPNKVGNQLRKEGFKWIATPHGMLEPWSLMQKKKRKRVFWSLFEKSRLENANIIRAVGYPEYLNLKKKLNINNSILHIPNCVDEVIAEEKKWGSKLSFLFMARIHNKKGVVPLAQAWKKSILNNSEKYELLIAGPDNGALVDLEREIKDSDNIKYMGAIYGEEKSELLKRSHFYVLPSYSEGFPTSVLEALNEGLISLITSGCNFPEVLEKKIAFEITPEVDNIQQVMERLIEFNSAELSALSNKGHVYIQENYITDVISKELDHLYKRLI
jgi:glycosyltransferase involved in cell wall biosynthesis